MIQVAREGQRLQRYAHIGTGNYNSVTARTYEDFGLFTDDEAITADLAELFNHLTGYSRPGEYRRLLVAPMHLRDELRDLIRGQAHPDGVIAMKINGYICLRNY